MKSPFDLTTTLIIAGAAVIGIVLLRKLPSAGEVWNGATEVAMHTADATAGVLTGNNVITQTARTDAYQGAGVIGTLGAATDQILGGVPSQIGEWLGRKTYDWTH